MVHATAKRGGLYAPSYSAYWSVYIDFTTEAAEGIPGSDGSGCWFGIAIIVEGHIVSSPTVAEPISNGSVVLTGSFTKTQARSLASSLSGSG